jgi:outer membrane protein assembly factor BamB
MSRIGWIASLALLMSISNLTHAVITVLTPLKQVLEKEQFIFVAKVKEQFPDKPAMILVFQKHLKGEAPFDRMPVSLTGDSEAAKDKHTEKLLERLSVDQEIVVFSSKRGKKYTAFAFTNGTWFQMEGRAETQDGKDVVRWAFLHAEPYLRRTFKGTTEELKQVVVDGLSGKKMPPEPDPKEPPGFGPVLPKKSSNLVAPSNGLLGVIQLPFLGLIAALAALFPTAFGGLALLMKRWVALLSFLSIWSLFFSVYLFFPGWLPEKMQSTLSFLIGSAIVAVVFALWAGLRYRKSLLNADYDAMLATKWDLVGLGAVGIVTAAVVGFIEMNQSIEVVSCLNAGFAAILLGCVAVVIQLVRKSLGSLLPALISVETVMLGTIFVVFVVTGSHSQKSLQLHKNEIPDPSVSNVDQLSNLQQVFISKDFGAIDSSLCLHDELLFASQRLESGFSQTGKVICLDMKSKEVRWTFDDDDEMKPTFGSPVYHDGSIFVGEGYHQHAECRLFRLDASTGKKIWEFKTASHVESNPVIVADTVIFGAGNDGVYGVNRETGKEVWHYQGKSGIHVDSNPVASEGLVFLGSGNSRTHELKAIFALDAKTGQEVWSERVELSAYGSPIVEEGVVYFGLGNGNYSEDRLPKHGFVLAREAKTGKKVWDATFPGTIIGKPAIDRYQIYVPCRNGSLFAVDRRTGQINWKCDLGNILFSEPKLIASANNIAVELLIVDEQGIAIMIDPYRGIKKDRLSIKQELQMSRSVVYGNSILTSLNEGSYRLFVPTSISESEIGSTRPQLISIDIKSDFPRE